MNEHTEKRIFELMATLFQLVEGLQADVATLKAAPVPTDPTAAIAAAVAPVEAKVDALAALVGTPSATTA